MRGGGGFKSDTQSMTRLATQLMNRKIYDKLRASPIVSFFCIASAHRVDDFFFLPKPDERSLSPPTPSPTPSPTPKCACIMCALLDSPASPS